MTIPDQEDTSPANNLLALGPGEGSSVEQIKMESHHLRGHIVEELNQDMPRFSEEHVQLIKFHGMYQQEDRDLRQTRKAAGAEKAYQFMIRSRIPGGVVTAEQYLVQDDLADRYGNGSLRITTRQGFQLHGVIKGDIRPTIKHINDALLSTLSACGDVNRNVMACAASPTSPAHQRMHEIAHQIAMHLAPRSTAYHEIWLDGEKAVTVGESEDEQTVEPIYGPTYLPRKFKIGVAYPGDNCIDVYTQDIGLVARIEGNEIIGFTVVIGGGMGTTHGKAETYPRLATPLADITTDQVLPIVETIVTVQRDYGDRKNRKHARMKYVVEERGIVWFRAEVERRLGYTLNDPSEIAFQDVDDHLGWHRQADGRWFLGLHIVNGRLKDTEAQRTKTGLREVIQQFHPSIRLTAQQNILLADIAEDQRTALESKLNEYSISADPSAAGAYRFAMACPALPTCGLAVAEAERYLPDLVKQIETELHKLGLGSEPLSIRMTGCPNGCARPHMGDIGFVGRSKGIYNIYVGGDWANTRLNTLYASTVRTENILPTLRPLLMLWRDERLSGETFGDYCHRIGIEQLQERATAQAGIKS
jgi:sulfite reductase (ferredoxin)